MFLDEKHVTIQDYLESLCELDENSYYEIIYPELTKEELELCLNNVEKMIQEVKDKPEAVMFYNECLNARKMYL